MADTNINPVALSSAVIAGAAGATVATNAKPITKKIVDVSEPIVDTVSVSAEKVVATAKSEWNKLVECMENFVDLLGKSIVKGLNALKNFFSELKDNKIKLPEKIFSKQTDKAIKLVKTPAIVAGIAAGALYTGYKLISAKKED